MSELIEKISTFLDELTGFQGAFGYLVIILLVLIGHSWMNSSSKGDSAATTIARDGGGTSSSGRHATGPSPDEPDPPRNFTMAQLRHFDGTKDPKTNEDKPVYLSLNGIVFDVSEGRNFYGEDGPYAEFAGRECGIALAKMSFDAQYLDDLEGCSKLNHGERMELENWIEKFQHYRCYPVLGRLVPNNKLPSPDRLLSKQDIAKFNGTGDTPEGYATPPIYLGAGDKVYDMSFGGVTFYGPECSYNRFAGRDASRALAKMSFEQADIDSSNVDDLTDRQREVLQDWIKTFEERKGYPAVGRMKKD